MKTTLLIALFVIFASSSCNSQNQSKQQDTQKYGQKPPGAVPELYQPIFSFLEGIEYGDIVFSPNGKEICFTLQDTSTKQSIIYYVHMEKKNWTKPELAYFIPENSIGSIPQFSPDGKRFSYTYKGDLWSSLKKDDQWLMAEKMDKPVCSDKYECGFSFALNGSVYFASNGRPEGKGQCDIYFSKLKDTQFEPSYNIDSLNTSSSECVVSVSPDEKYIVFTRYINKNGQNATDLYISFRKPAGDWTLAQKLGQEFNSSGANFNPVFSTDGKYFFFNQFYKTDDETFEMNRYWVSTIFFDDLKELTIGSKEK